MSSLRPHSFDSTQIGRPHSRPHESRTLSSPSCGQCGALLHGRPFCPEDGWLAEAFDVAERYRVEEALGAGGMALVFGARHKALGKHVALKLLRAELAASREHAQRFVREGRLASQLSHENIVSVSDFGHDAVLGLPFLVMDRLRGPTLAQLMNERVPLERAVPILLQLTRALAAAHEQGIIHRDLSPRNIVLEESSGRDIVKLCDFGVSRMIHGEERITRAGELLGTPVYMAPEQVRGDATDEPRLDVYSFGVVAYEMLTGELPYRARTSMAILAAKIFEPVEPISERFPSIRVPRALEAAILRCLERDPSARPTASELATVLTETSLGAITALEPEDLVGRTIGSYRVRAHLGTGGMGSVYRAEHPAIGTQVAIKVLLPEVAASAEAVERFVREARAASAIESPHIPRYYDFGRLRDGRAYAVMEYVEGESLASRLERCGPFALEEAASLLLQTARALGEAHALGIVHRDIKPDNLFLAWNKHGEPFIKVLDFGIAKVADDGSPGLTTSGAFIGTPSYSAPEQIFGQAVGPQADVYALGATAYEMLTGRTPFEGDLSEIFTAKARDAAPSVRESDPSLPPAVDRTLAIAMARHACDRFASMEELCRSVHAWSAPESELPVAKRARNPLVLVAALSAPIVLAAIAGLSVFALASEPRAPRRSMVSHAASPPARLAAPPSAGPAIAPIGARVEVAVAEPAVAPEPAPRARQRARHARRLQSVAPTPPSAPRAAPRVNSRSPIIADPFAE